MYRTRFTIVAKPRRPSASSDLAGQSFVLGSASINSVQMIMVNLFSEFLGSSYIDFVSVHYCRYNIIRTEFFLDEMIGFFIKLLCIRLCVSFYRSSSCWLWVCSWAWPQVFSRENIVFCICSGV